MPVVSGNWWCSAGVLRSMPVLGIRCQIIFWICAFKIRDLVIFYQCLRVWGWHREMCAFLRVQRLLIGLVIAALLEITRPALNVVAEGRPLTVLCTQPEKQRNGLMHLHHLTDEVQQEHGPRDLQEQRKDPRRLSWRNFGPKLHNCGLHRRTIPKWTLKGRMTRSQ